MTPLRQRMLEDMQVRNLSPHTQPTYVENVARFARHFGRSPVDLGPEEIRTYQVYLIRERRLAPSSLEIAVCALRFLYKPTFPIWLSRMATSYTCSSSLDRMLLFRRSHHHDTRHGDLDSGRRTRCPRHFLDTSPALRPLFAQPVPQFSPVNRSARAAPRSAGASTRTAAASGDSPPAGASSSGRA
jgi:Phage integrase, N-terminal SAM-like domain